MSTSDGSGTGADVAVDGWDEFTRGPWMVFVSRPDELGHTVYHVAEHTHTAIALDRTYWAPDDEPKHDADGYYQPDDHADISDNKLANARLISASPDMLAALRFILKATEGIDALPAGSTDAARERARLAISRARGLA